jgi:hypothetical protein
VIKRPTLVVKKRTRRLNVFFDTHEYDQLVNEAKRARIKPSELMRQKFFNTPPLSVPQVNLEVWAKLSSASANLNQIARYLNSGMRLDAEEVSRILAAFRMYLVCARS